MLGLEMKLFQFVPFATAILGRVVTARPVNPNHDERGDLHTGLNSSQVLHSYPCPDTSLAFPLMRAYSTSYKDHFYTMTGSEIEEFMKNGYTFEGDAALLFSSLHFSTLSKTNSTSLTALYRLYNPQALDHFYTASSTERDNGSGRGYIYEGITGFLWPQQVCGSVPLYGLWNEEKEDHLYTIVVVERDTAIKWQGYVSQGIVGYVLEP
ncbi:hypothetical protein BDN72DRAFT_794419 [Pluteus cervinus]|uniref:Uncharacterized protein n=1 Tax=Pluteus cervinus TaxID=181527 RepID=A0ACD3B0K4_9AGAR|nr:hypothetical protein BDN72DRAFT_794419 [Pluteus cervinus]